jgi:hypothetical protein
MYLYHTFDAKGSEMARKRDTIKIMVSGDHQPDGTINCMLGYLDLQRSKEGSAYST